MPSDFHCKAVRVVDGIFRPGHLLPPRKGYVRLRGTERILHRGKACRRDVRRLRGGGGHCTDIVIKGKKTGEPQVILPCSGDRIFGMTADDEMAFTFPFGMGDEIVEGLEKTHAGGGRDPLPAHLRYQGEYPKAYQELEGIWQ